VEKRILDLVPDPIFIKDRGHRLVLVNDAFCRFMGASREQLLGHTGLDLVTPEEAAVFRAKDDAVIRTGVESVNEEEASFEDGRVHVVETRKSLYVNDDGERFVVGVIRDITERKRAETERDRLVEELRTALAEVRALEAIAAVCPACGTLKTAGR
jgi:PAS domain S-box-containing protein